MIRHLVPALLLIGLAACDEGAPPVAKKTAAPEAAPSPKPLTALPDAYVGRWGVTPADCNGKGPGSLTVTATAMTFAGPRASVGKIVELRPGIVTAELAYSGRTGKWSTPATMMLRDDGKTLVRDETHPTGRFTYQRCAG